MKEETTKKEEFRIDGAEVWAKIKAFAREGNIRHLILKRKNGNTIFSMTVTIGVILTILAPQIVVIITLIALFLGCSVVVEKSEILDK